MSIGKGGKFNFNTVINPFMLVTCYGHMNRQNSNCNGCKKCKICKAIFCYYNNSAIAKMTSSVGNFNIYVMMDHTLFITTERYRNTILSEINITKGGDIIMEQVNIVSKANKASTHFIENSIYGSFQNNNMAWIHYTGELPHKIRDLLFPRVPYYPNSQREEMAALKDDNIKLQKKINILQGELNKLRSELNILRSDPSSIWKPITDDDTDDDSDESWEGLSQNECLGRLYNEIG